MSTMSLRITAVRSLNLPRWSDLRTLFVEWRERARSRRQLASLDGRELWDMGLTRLTAKDEANNTNPR